MPSKKKARGLVRNNLGTIAERVNVALRGEGLEKIEHVLERIGRDGRLPHWYNQLKRRGTFPNLDGKTIGSVIEMLLVGVLETGVLKDSDSLPLTINPAKGVDLPTIDLGVKSPSENFCTSEPYFSAYERLLGSEYDIAVLLTDYQTAKKKPPLKLQVIQWKYLEKSEIADKGLCEIARKHRKWILQENEAWAKKLFRFLAFVNQSDWRASWILKLVEQLRDDDAIRHLIQQAPRHFNSRNANAFKKDRPLVPNEDLASIEAIGKMAPLQAGVIDAADNWVVDTQKEIGRLPSDNEWNRLLRSPLDGKIGMSFALQWRYNFGKLFKEPKKKSK